MPELSVHENGRIYKFVNDAVQAAVTGTQKPQEALAAAQQQADRVLRRTNKEQRAGWRFAAIRLDHPMADQTAISPAAARSRNRMRGGMR